MASNNLEPVITAEWISSRIKDLQSESHTALKKAESARLAITHAELASIKDELSKKRSCQREALSDLTLKYIKTSGLVLNEITCEINNGKGDSANEHDGWTIAIPDSKL